MSDDQSKDSKKEMTLPQAVSKVGDAIGFLAVAVILSGLLQCNGMIAS